MIKIITDTTSGLPLKLAEKYNTPVLPQIVIFGEETYRDDTSTNSLRPSSPTPIQASWPSVTSLHRRRTIQELQK